MNSRARVCTIMGPVGAGKTRTVFVKLIRLAAEQRPSPIDGCRYFKCCIVRDTYRQLWTSTIPSWWEVMPKDSGSWAGGAGDPEQCVIEYQLPDWTRPVLILDFIAIAENRAEDVLRGYQPTCFYFNEADLLDEDVFTHAMSRTGRFPEKIHGGPSWYGILCDMNAPDTENWTYRRLQGQENTEFFQQPSGLSAEAENLANLVPDYYAEKMKNMDDWWIRRFIRNEWGYSREGKPIYPEFTQRHVAGQPLRPMIGLPLIIGLDAGLHPAAVICQHTPLGQWRIIEEVVGEMGTGATRFGERLAQVLRDRYANWRAISAWADPSAAYGADKEAGEQTWIEIVGAKAGLMILAAPTNGLIPRWEAVRGPLRRDADPGLPAFVISPTCPTLIKGFYSGYHFRRMQIPGMPRYEEKAEKNDYSHPHDALQYAMLGGGEDAELADRKQFIIDAPNLPRHSGGWDPFDVYDRRR